jgi:antitoxin ParD1/3/4
MPTRNVVLSDHQHELVEELVRSGRYQNASEVLRDGLRMIERQMTEDATRLRTLRAAADQGWTDVATGRFDDVADEDLADFIGQLGIHASRNAAAAGE